MPFTVNPDIMAKIRPMTKEDVPRVAQLHALAMGKSLWAQLGERFLREIYRALLKSEHFLGFVYQEDGQIEGFIAGSRNSKIMMRSAFLRRGYRLGLAALLGLRNPEVLKQLTETAKYFRRSQANLSDEILAESLFCSFTPKLRGKKVAGHINKVLFDQLFLEGHQQIKITTETDNVGANRQLKSWGFQSKGTFQFYAKEMVTYVLHFGESDRVEKKTWCT